MPAIDGSLRAFAIAASLSERARHRSWLHYSSGRDLQGRQFIEEGVKLVWVRPIEHRRRVVAGRGIPSHEHLHSLFLREHAQADDWIIGMSNDLFQKDDVVAQHAVHRRRVEKVGAVLHRQTQALRDFGGEERQVEL